MRLIRVLLIAILFPFLVAPTANAAESSGSFSVVLPGDIGFGAGGVDGEFLVFSAWSSTPAIPYGINTIIEHNSALWWATSTPAASDEPGVASLWEKITDQTGGGGGFSFTQGNADPSGGSAGDWYLQHDGAGETEAIWFNIAGTRGRSTKSPAGKYRRSKCADGATGPFRSGRRGWIRMRLRLSP